MHANAIFLCSQQTSSVITELHSSIFFHFYLLFHLQFCHKITIHSFKTKEALYSDIPIQTIHTYKFPQIIPPSSCPASSPFEDTQRFPLTNNITENHHLSGSIKLFQPMHLTSWPTLGCTNFDILVKQHPNDITTTNLYLKNQIPSRSRIGKSLSQVFIKS